MAKQVKSDSYCIFRHICNDQPPSRKSQNINNLLLNIKQWLIVTIVIILLIIILIESSQEEMQHMVK